MVAKTKRKKKLIKTLKGKAKGVETDGLSESEGKCGGYLPTGGHQGGRDFRKRMRGSLYLPNKWH